MIAKLKRREFITLLGGAAAAWPLAARAQQAGKLATIGCLVPGTPSSHGQWFAVFVQRLRELGWIEGRTVAVEYRWAEGRSERFTEIAAEFVQRKVDVIVTASTAAVLAAKQATSVQATARTLGLEVITLEIRRGEDIAPAFEALKGRAEALYVLVDPLVATHRIRINTLVLAARLPTMHTQRESVELGGLMSYGANFPDLFRRAADLVDKILRGAKPADIPVEQPTKFDLVINLTTAKALGLTIPESFLHRADEVIE